MATEPLFFELIFKERTWGGNASTSSAMTFHQKERANRWAFAAHQNGQSVIAKRNVQRAHTKANYGNITGIYSDTLRETAFLF
ncbi:hypothetical protein P7F88_10975 [Vibrio hannami]|nr:hypothetical protein [Vibrio hannami]MDG3086606.1 hypothetical protein [Vibrio hannami]